MQAQYSLVFTANFTLHNLHCKWKTCHYIALTVNCTLHPAYCTQHTAHFTLHTLYCTLHTSYCTLHPAQYTPNNAHYTQHTVYRTLSTVHCTQKTVHCTLWISVERWRDYEILACIIGLLGPEALHTLLCTAQSTALHCTLTRIAHFPALYTALHCTLPFTVHCTMASDHLWHYTVLG